MVVAETDAGALAIARRAYPRWRQSFRWLFDRHGVEPRITALYPPTFDELRAIDNGVAGSPRTVRDFLAAEIEASGANYLLSWFAFGDMTLRGIAPVGGAVRARGDAGVRRRAGRRRALKRRLTAAPSRRPSRFAMSALS